jgi:dGTPase
MIRHLIGSGGPRPGRSDRSKATASGVRSVEELQRLAYNVIDFSEDMYRRNRELKDFLYAKLYRHHRVMRMAVKAERIIGDLFKHIARTSHAAGPHPELDRRARPGEDYL